MLIARVADVIFEGRDLCGVPSLTLCWGYGLPARVYGKVGYHGRALRSREEGLKRIGIILSALCSIAWLFLAIEWFRGVRSVPLLRDECASVRSGSYPAVWVILAARDEEAALEKGVGSMLAQDYPGDLEVVAVNDRSADRTGEILGRLAARHTDTLHVLHVQQLPDGWLGKTNALHLGAAEAWGSGCCSPTRTYDSLPIACEGPWTMPTVWG